MKTQLSYIGIDVSKKSLHVSSPKKFIKEVSNTVSGHEELVRLIKEIDPVLIVVEASGGYERLVVDAMQNAELPVSVCQPSCIRHFAQSVSVLAKTDKIDARVIAWFGEATKPRISAQVPENVRKIRALTHRRQQVVEDRVRESNRLETCADRDIARQLQESIERLQRLEQEIEQQINRMMNDDVEFQKKTNLLTQQKGVGLQTTRVLLAQLPELGTVSRQEVAALAGLAPHPKESGQWKGKRRIYGGRTDVRKALFMAARTAARWCPILSKYYDHLRKAGKPYKVAIIACARKLLVRLNTVMKQHLEKSSNFCYAQNCPT